MTQERAAFAPALILHPPDWHKVDGSTRQVQK